ncbi:hypothetical protein GCM10022224_007620 [Nonomuraea antimicrobica]|uniref:Nucleotidyltransferase domain-containing protein n=1 Tax=Nonomuraea antimicrobica TaxID=561173 RepID=A0ABP7B3M7_9ACTN
MRESVAERVAREVVAAYAECGALDFAYGQGSVFSGFTNDSDLDIVIVWGADEPPPPARRPAGRLSDPGCEPTQFHEAAYGLDKLRVSGWEVDVAHCPRARFDSWCALVAAGDGWQEPEWPQPLHAVAGFVHGTLLADDRGTGEAIRRSMRTPAPRLAAKAGAALERQLPAYADALLACARDDDGWLFHDLAARLVRQLHVAWFAAEGHYLPFPKHLRRWVRRLGLDEGGALLERRIWETATLHERRLAIVRFAEHVLGRLPAG